LNKQRSTSKILYLVNTILLLIISSPFLTIQYKSYSYVEAPDISDSDETSRCVSYDVREKEIKLTCKLAHLSDIYNQLTDRTIFNKEGQLNDSNNNNIWLLNAGITVEKGSTLIIDPKDTKWLKIFDDRKIAYPIIVHGSLLIDSVKVTSWDPNINDYVKFDPEILQDKEHEHTGIDAVPRPYIMIDKGATGTTNITNSEIAYLGYECGGGCSGISYYGKTNVDTNYDHLNIIKNNEIHNNRFGFYSVNASNILIENNIIHHNFMYGLDPHTGTHNIVIRNNTVHDHGAMGIICSLNCYDVTIENNTVFNSAGSGIMFSRNMYNSIARDNIVHNESKCIFISQSHDNEIYNNKVDSCNNGIYLFNKSFANSVHNNTIGSFNESGLRVSSDSTRNHIYSNQIAAESVTESKDKDHDHDH
jgi:mannuronan 5-epimerase